MDGGCRSPVSFAVGLCLLPSELLLEIFFRLALPEILRLTAVSRSLRSLVSGDDFRRHYDGGGGWIFVYKKRPPRDSVLRGFNDRSGRWFKFPVPGILTPAVPPGEDLYFLAAAGDFFLFASNGRRELIAVNLKTSAVTKIPACPLGPRGTSSWRRSGLKLLAGPSGSDRFRFLFAELSGNQPVLFDYCSETDTWQAEEAAESDGRLTVVGGEKDRVFLNITQHGRGNAVVYAGGRRNEPPLVFRPRFLGAAADCLHVYGDGKLAIVRSAATGDESRVRVRVLVGVELWGMAMEDGREWELISKVPVELVEKVRKPYGVMMGCLELEWGREGMIRVVLMSNYRGSWDLVWLNYDGASGSWSWVPVPDSGTKGLNMAGIAISSSLGLRLSSNATG